MRGACLYHILLLIAQLAWCCRRRWLVWIMMCVGIYLWMRVELAVGRIKEITIINTVCEGVICELGTVLGPYSRNACERRET